MTRKLLKLVSVILPLLVGLVFILFFFRNNLFNGAVNFNPHVGTNDYMDLNVPFRKFLIDSYKKGEIPVWSSEISAGYPILAEGQIAALYPVNILTINLGAELSYAFGLAFTYFLIYSFAYLYLREIDLGRMASTFGAMLVTFGGFSANEIMHYGMLVSFAYFVGIIYLVEKFVKSGKRFLVPLMGIFLGLSILGGHPQIIIYSMIFVYLYWLVRWIFAGKKIYKLVIYAFLMSVIGLGIGAGQLLPQYEFTTQSTRSAGLSSEEIYRYSFPLSGIATFFNPFGNYSVERSVGGFAANGWPTDERYVYPSIVGFSLFLAGLYYVRKKNYFAIIFFSAFVFAFFFSAGNLLGAGVLHTIPPLSFFRIRINEVTNFLKSSDSNSLLFTKSDNSISFILLF